MNSLTVLYDDRCGFCERVTRWLRIQHQAVPLRVLGTSTPEARRLCEMIQPPIEKDELIVIADNGSVWRGAGGMLMCLWALNDYRAWSLRLSSPALRPFVRRAFDVFSSKRYAVSRLLGLTRRSVDEVLADIDAQPEPMCEVP